MTKTAAHSIDPDTSDDVSREPTNPRRAELKSSLVQADFPKASHMAKNIFGESPRQADDEE